MCFCVGEPIKKSHKNIWHNNSGDFLDRRVKHKIFFPSVFQSTALMLNIMRVKRSLSWVNRFSIIRAYQNSIDRSADEEKRKLLWIRPELHDLGFFAKRLPKKHRRWAISFCRNYRLIKFTYSSRPFQVYFCNKTAEKGGVRKWLYE